MSLKEKRDFFIDLFERHTIPEPIDSIAHVNSPRLTLLTNTKSNKSCNNRVFYSIKWVPKYLITKTNTNYKAYKIAHYHKGYSIKIDDSLNTVDEYLKLQFKSKAYKITRYVKRLETCYHLKCKSYHGNISKNEYDTLFDALKIMLVSRFKQKKKINDRLQVWDELYNMYYTLINEGKASIIVVYESGIPISISLNLLFGKFCFNTIISYNLDYTKFGKGHVMIYKQLDWCIKNKFSLYDMGKGVYYNFKEKWCNQIYHLDHLFLVPKKSNFVTVIVYKIEIFKIQWFEYLRSKKWYVLSNKIKNGIYFMNSSKESIEYKTSAFSNMLALKEMELINYNYNDYLNLHKPVNDFLYSNSIHKDNIKIYKNINEKYFVIAGNNKAIKIMFIDS